MSERSEVEGNADIALPERPRFCPRCDPYFARRKDMRHTYDEGCELARPGIQPRPWTEQERKNHEFVAEVERHLERLAGQEVPDA